MLPGLIINVSYDNSVTSLMISNPTLYAEYTSAVQTAVQFYMTSITNPITITIDFGWDEVKGQPIQGFAGESRATSTYYTYSQLYNALRATDTTSPVQLAAVASLPTKDLTNAGTFEVYSAEQEALGLASANSGSQGWVGLGSTTAWSWTQTNVASGTVDATGVLEHEISEVLGRHDNAGLNGSLTNIFTPLDLFRYTAANGSAADTFGSPVGSRDEPFPGAGYDTNAYSYFSYNGTTVTLPYNAPTQVTAGDDVADWANSVRGDSYSNDFGTGIYGLVSTTDLEEMNVLGYNLTGNPLLQHFNGVNTSTGTTLLDTSTIYSGPVAGIQWQFITETADSLAVTATVPNGFIHTGSGADAIDVSHVNGTNVLDGSTGSNFLVGGTGFDTFFVDNRAAAADIWSTLVNFHTGDAATVWGVSASDFAFDWQDNQGAAGFTGLTLHATATGKPVASMTLVGYTEADLSNGHLSVSFGNDAASGSDYMYVRGS